MAKMSLEERVERIEAVHEIQNLVGRYSYLHTAGMQEETVELFAQKTPGVSAEIGGWGVYDGIEGIKRLYPGFHNFAEGDRVGQMHMHTFTTPVIEVAYDLKTAKGIWISPGHETGAFVDGKLEAYWAWCKYGCDFVKEEEWKIWHLHVYGLFICPYDKSWVEFNADQGDMEVPDNLKPDKPATYNWHYSPTGKTELVPAPPEPYETWDGKSVA